MSAAVIRVALRSTAIAIAIAAIVDPVFSVSAAPRAPVAIIGLTSSDAGPVERRLRASLDDRDVSGRDAGGGRLPCAPGEQCVVIADGSVDVDLPVDGLTAVSLIAMESDGTPNVWLQSVTVSQGQHAATAGVARVELGSRGMVGRRTELRLTDGGAVIGFAVHQWSDGQVETAIDVPWWPIETGGRTIRVEAIPAEGEVTAFDNAIDVGVSVTTERLAVLVFDPRPSWGSTFVRRALEDDPRFHVEHRARVAPSVSAGTANGRLDPRALGEASVVIVGGLEALTASDVDLLERFVRVRGGTLVLLPEQRPSGAAARLFPGVWTEQLASGSERIGQLRASEILRTDGAPIASTVLGSSGPAPSLVLVPAGNGTVVVSGAMDAWRYRQADDNAFDRFWRSLVADAGAASAALTLDFDRDLGSPGSRARFTLRSRTLEPQRTVEASAVLRCGSEPARSIRLWPAGTMGAFEGEIPLASSDQCSVEGRVGDRFATAAIAVAKSAARGASATLAKLERFAAATGGAIGSAGHEAAVAAAIMAEPPSAPTRSPVRPMRSAWWILPFAACLATEWWRRRRQGLR